jgi:hypothetical protein
LINLLNKEPERRVTREQYIYLWINSKTAYSENRIREKFLALFVKYVGKDLSISLYRHAAIAFIEKNLKGYLVDVAPHFQAGKRNR